MYSDSVVDVDGVVGRRERSRWAGVVRSLPLVAPVAWILSLGWVHRSVNEDGFIYLRIVRQIEAGNGPVFNAGERVEAYTGVLWLAVLTVADLVTPFPLEWLAVMIGLVLTACGVAFAMLGARRLWALPGTVLPDVSLEDVADESRTSHSMARDQRWFVPLGMVVFVAIFPTWVFATSGLETGLVFAWLGACLWVLARWSGDAGRRLTVPELALVGLGWLVRPELVLFSAAFVGAVLATSWAADDWRNRARVVVAATAIPVAYQIFRMGYFGSLVANTAVAKSGTSTNLARGRRYFFDFVDAYWLWLPMLGLVLAGLVPLALFLVRARLTRRSAVVSAFIGGGVVLAAYVVAVGGDYIHARLFLPALMALCCPLAVVPATKAHVTGLVVAAWAAVAAVDLRPAQLGPGGFLANGLVFVHQSGSVTLADLEWDDGGARRAWFEGPGYYVQRGLFNYAPVDLQLRPESPDEVVVMWGIGTSGYAMDTDVYVYDMLGLADVITSHFEVPQPGLAGHEKPSRPAWTAARLTAPGSQPDVAAVPPVPDPLDPATIESFPEDLAWARAALQCGAIADLHGSATEPLSVGRFFENLVGAPGRTRVRIPIDPEEAYRRFCGDEVPIEVERVRRSPTP